MTEAIEPVESSWVAESRGSRTNILLWYRVIEYINIDVFWFFFSRIYGIKLVSERANNTNALENQFELYAVFVSLRNNTVISFIPPSKAHNIVCVRNTYSSDSEYTNTSMNSQWHWLKSGTQWTQTKWKIKCQRLFGASICQKKISIHLQSIAVIKTAYI